MYILFMTYCGHLCLISNEHAPSCSLLHVLNSASLWKNRGIVQSDLYRIGSCESALLMDDLNKLLPGNPGFRLDVFISEREADWRMGMEWSSKK